MSSVVTVPQPQTTLEPPGGPFIRYSEPGYKPQYTESGVAFGGQVTNPLVAVPGYVSRFRVRIYATGGANTAGTVATTADAPFNAVQLVNLSDANGNPIFNGPGYEMLYLVPLFSGGYGLLAAANIQNMPSYQAPSVGTSGTGDFSFRTALPLELTKAYGLLGMAAANVMPTLTWTLSGSSTVYSTAPTTVPTLTVKVGAEYYWLPQSENIAPPGLGTSRQWLFNKSANQPAASSYLDVQFPRPGGYLDTIILVCRDSTGARVDAWPDPLSIWVDGVPMVNQEPLTDIYDDIYNVFGGVTRPTGVLAFSRKTSLSQISLGLLDTGEEFLSTNPGTLLQVGGTWGSAGTGPYTISVITGQVVPSEALLQGLPEV